MDTTQNFDPDKVQRLGWNQYCVFQEEDGPLVHSSDYDRLLSLYKEVVCFKCTKSEEIDAYGKCYRHNLMAYLSS